MEQSTTIQAVVIVLLGIGVAYAAKLKYESPQPPVAEFNDSKPEWKSQQVEPVQPEVKEPEVPTINEKNIKSYQEAVSLAAKVDKKVLLFFSSESCPHCTHMKSATLTDKSVKKALEPYIFYEVNTDKERSIASKFNVRGIPAYRIIDKTEKVIAAGEGDKRPAAFIIWVNAVTNPGNAPGNRRLHRIQ